MQLTSATPVHLAPGLYRISEIRSFWKPGQCSIVTEDGKVTLLKFHVGGKGASVGGTFELDKETAVRLRTGYQVDASVRLENWI